MIAHVDERGPGFGFVWIAPTKTAEFRTRLGFSKHDGEVRVWLANGYPEPTWKEKQAAVAALVDAGILG